MANGVVSKGAAKNMQKAKADVKTQQQRDGAFARMKRFLRESYIEVRYKAAWPTWDELKKFTAVVILAVIVVGVYIGGLDWILTQVTRALGMTGGAPKPG